MTRGLDPRRAYYVVDQFERELQHYTGAKHAVTVDSCTNALFLALRLELQNASTRQLSMPRRTYVGVMQAALNAGWIIRWHDDEWNDNYRMEPTRVVDSARHIARGMYEPGTLTCLSFHAAKQLALGRGGAVLTDDDAAAEWLRRARQDGRAPGDTEPYATLPGWHMYLPPPTAALGMWILTRWGDNSPAPLPPDNYPDLSVL
jgi:dTDP-4-amino-4,6-dideoxygalactose transaminase